MMKSKNIGLFISVVFIYGVFVIKGTIANPGLLINRENVIYVIKHVAGTYFFATIFEIIILLIFLNHYHLKFKLFTYIPFIKLITYPFILFGYVFNYLIYYFGFISLAYYIVMAGGSTVYIEYIFLLDKLEKSGVWILDKKLKSLTLAGIIVANIIPFSYTLFLMGIWPPIFLFDPFKSF